MSLNCMPIWFGWEPPLSIPRYVKFLRKRNTSWCIICTGDIFCKTKNTKLVESMEIKALFIWKNRLIPCRKKPIILKIVEESPSIHTNEIKQILLKLLLYLQKRIILELITCGQQGNQRWQIPRPATLKSKLLIFFRDVLYISQGVGLLCIP